MPDKAICQNCSHVKEYSTPNNLASKTLRCHYYPPQVVGVPTTAGVQIMAVFPPVESNNHCSKFEENP